MQDSILNIDVSAFRNYNTPTGPKSVNLLHWLTANKYQNEVAAIRAEPDKEKRNMIKSTLPAITPSGQFSHRSEAGLITHSGFIQVDIDFKDNSHITNYNDLKQQLCKIVNVAYCGLSVSGTGYFLLLPIAHREKHRQHFDYLYKVFKSMGIAIDRKPRNVASLRSYSPDADAYFNHKAVKLEQYEKPAPKPLRSIYNIAGNDTQSQIESLINTINKTGKDIAPNYDEWLNLGFALATEFGERARSYFHDISRFHADYNHSMADRQFDKCISSNGSGITIKTFFHLCKVSGIELPKQNKAVSFKIIKSKTKQRQQQPLHLLSSNIEHLPTNHFTSKEFEQIIIQGIETKDGCFYDLLFSADGEPIQPGEKAETVNRLATFFEKDLQPALFDNNLCWVHCYKQSIVNNN